MWNLGFLVNFFLDFMVFFSRKLTTGDIHSKRKYIRKIRSNLKKKNRFFFFYIKSLSDAENIYIYLNILCLKGP